MAKSIAYIEEVNKIKKKIDKLNTICRGMVLDDDDYEVIINELARTGLMLARNKSTYMEKRMTELQDRCNDLVRRAQ